MNEHDGRDGRDLDHEFELMQKQADVDRALIEHLEADALIDREKIANLEIGLASARQIGTAIGILMMGRKVTAEQAFDLLRIASQRSSRKLRDIAQDVVDTGTLTDAPPRSPENGQE